MAGDWIKIHRKIIDSRVNSDAGLFHVWINLLLRASWKPSWFMKRQIEPGQVAFSITNFAAVLKISESTLRRRLKELKDDGSIATSATNKFTIVTICNWETYQRDDRPERRTKERTDDTPSEAPRDAADDTSTDQSNGEPMTEPLNEQSANERRATDIHSKKVINKQTSTPLPPSVEEPVSMDPEWAVVVEEVFLAGVSQGKAREVCGVARDNGCRPALVRACVAFWNSQRPAWEPGGLAIRIENLRPGQSAGDKDRWPPRSAEASAEHAAAKRAENDRRAADQRAAADLEHKKRLAENDRHRERMAKLAAEFGPILDAKSPTEIRQFTHNVCGDQAVFYVRMYKGGKPEGLHRECLLEAMARMAVKVS